MSRPSSPVVFVRRCWRLLATLAICLLAAGASLGAAMTLSGRFGPGLPAPKALPAPQDAPYDLPVQSPNHFGEITVAQPKIWQYERVNSLLDGLLRDVQGVSMADLTSLDPNATNGAAVRFVQSMLEIGAQYNQGQAAANQLALQSYRTNVASANAQNAANQDYLQQLYQERTQTNGELLGAMQLNSSLLGQLANAPAGTDTSTLTAQQTAANTEVTTLQQELTTINSQITAASTTTQPPLPNLTPTAAGAPPESPTTFSSFLNNLPAGLTTNIVNQLQTPTLPATKRLDNFITLLYERLAREISALQDDLLRDPENLAFLVQFDVSLYPSKHSEDRVGVVDFGLECRGCKVYSIYPGQSSYNLANYQGASKRYQFWGNLLTLFGLGISADYRRQEDTLQGDLVQSVYISGFQEGAESYDRGLKYDATRDIGTKVPVEQRFGWYYGAAPFEKLVSPGIRSTFAILTVPRKDVTECLQGRSTKDCASGLRYNDRSGDVELQVDVHAGWTPRDNPRAYHSRYLPSSALQPMTVVLPGADGAVLPRVVAAERDRLHVLGIEYNPVYLDEAPANPSTIPTAAPGTAQATASGNGSGSATVTVSGAGTATANSTGTSNSTATATATNPTPTSGSSSTVSSSFGGCKPANPCAGILVKLAEPIDPDMVVTVRGQPLLRVRDWRGRATSIYPPAQSASDRITASTAVSGTTASTTSGTTTSGNTTNQPVGSENASSNSLLEAEQLGPNTWMEVDSHRLLLNVTEDLAGEEDFPAIQIVSPAKHALFIPTDLDTSFTEVETNGYHLIGRDDSQLRGYICDRLTALGDPGQSICLTRSNADPIVHPTGPYAPETFLPVFLPEPDDQPIYAYMGESGVQILIGFDRDPLSGAPPKFRRWVSSRSQAILEDKELDLAWSLSCYPQGDNLACDFPRQEIRDTYDMVQRACGRYGGCPSTANGNFPSISTLQVWVEQSDPEEGHPNAFRSAAPARLGRFPVERGGPIGADQPNSMFSPWHFESASPETVTLTGCNYPDWSIQAGYDINLLGQHIPGQDRTYTLRKGSGPGCVSFDAPTIAFSRPEFVVLYQSDPEHPDTLETSRLRPSFGKPIVSGLRNSGNGFSLRGWLVELPVGNVDCNDTIDVRGAFDSSPATAAGDPRWLIGGAQPIYLRAPDGLSPTGCPNANPNWQQVSESAQIHLAMTITKANLSAYLEHRDIHLIRGRDRIEVATLPDLRSLLLPVHLTVESISDTQFALKGVNAEAIDEVSLQGPSGLPQLLPASISDGIAVFALPASTKTSPSGQGSQRAAGGGQPKVTRISSSSAEAGSTVTITGENFGSAEGTVTLELPAPAPAKPLASKPAQSTNPPPAPQEGRGAVAGQGGSGKSGGTAGLKPSTGGGGVGTSGPAAANTQGGAASTSSASGASTAPGAANGAGAQGAADQAGAAGKPANVPAAKPTPPGKRIEAEIVCWTDTSIEIMLPSNGLSDQAYTVKVTPAKNATPSPDQIRIVSSSVSAAKPACASPSGPASGGTYTILPLIVSTSAGTTSYFPITNTDSNGKPAPLTWVVLAAQKSDTTTPKPSGPTTTVTITKQTTTTPATTGSTKAAPTAAPAAAGKGGGTTPPAK